MSSYCKYYKEKKQVSYDNGVTYIDVVPAEYRKGELIESSSIDCEYPPVYSGQYLTFVALEDGVSWYGGYSGTDLSYSVDSGATWVSQQSPFTMHIELNTGEKIMWKGHVTKCVFTSSNDKKYNVEGNSMSLVYGNDYVGKTSLSGASFEEMFSSNGGLVSAENLVLPALTMTDRCYRRMFLWCTSLTRLPKLPATTMAYECYKEMFYGCTSLTTLPSNYLPATELAEGCYYEMFQECYSLKEVNFVLPATIMAARCYGQMFSNCTSLETVPSNMLPATTLAAQCYYAMFVACPLLATAPVLPARILATRCYGYMFNGSTSLNHIECLGQNVSTDNTWGWTINVSSTGTFIKDANTTWSRGVDGIPSNWIVKNA